MEQKKKINADVLEFIRKIREHKDHSGNMSESITDLFASGYCYYFAVLLQHVYGGEICWVEGRGHIVWLDGNDLEHDIAYDIYGVYDDYDRLRPISYLGDMIQDFLHTGEEYVCKDRDFHEWCEFYKVPDIRAITDIWKRIPKEELMYYDSIGANCEMAVLLYWIKNKPQIQEEYSRNKNL